MNELYQDFWRVAKRVLEKHIGGNVTLTEGGELLPSVHAMLAQFINDACEREGVPVPTYRLKLVPPDVLTVVILMAAKVGSVDLRIGYTTEGAAMPSYDDRKRARADAVAMNDPAILCRGAGRLGVIDPHGHVICPLCDAELDVVKRLNFVQALVPDHEPTPGAIIRAQQMEAACRR